jgi:hypothetical protein
MRCLTIVLHPVLCDKAIICAQGLRRGRPLANLSSQRAVPGYAVPTDGEDVTNNRHRDRDCERTKIAGYLLYLGLGFLSYHLRFDRPH